MARDKNKRNEWQAAWRQRCKEKARERCRKWRQKYPEKQRARINKWRKENPEKMREYRRKRWQTDIYKLRDRAWTAVAYALKRGTIIKPLNCELCGDPSSATNKLDAHHEDYHQKLLIVWWCRKCHHIFTKR